MGMDAAARRSGACRRSGLADARARPIRVRLRALREWHDNYAERKQWEDDIGGKPSPDARSASERMAWVVKTAKRVGVTDDDMGRVTHKLNHADNICAAAKVVGWRPQLARARWREASGFAHGYLWASMHRADLAAAGHIPGGVSVKVTMGREHLAELARLVTDVVNRAFDDYYRLADDMPDPS
jgi:hypothetical protein